MKKTMNTSPKSLFRSICLLVLLALSPMALADALQDAKQSGAVGEQRDGYLGAVASSASAEVRALVARVNQERKARYEEIAKKNNLSLQQVQALAFEQAATGNSCGKLCSKRERCLGQKIALSLRHSGSTGTFRLAFSQRSTKAVTRPQYKQTPKLCRIRSTESSR